MMELSEYVAKILEPPKTALDFVDTNMLMYIIGHGFTSAYAIHSIFETEIMKGIDIRIQKEGLKPKKLTMRYKNIHRRIRSLYRNGFIEEVETTGRTPHGRIDYKISEKGLIYLFLNLKNIEICKLIVKYTDSAFIEIFINSIFEETTLRNCTYTLAEYLVNYLRRISVIIFYWTMPNTFTNFLLDSSKPFSSQITVDVKEHQLFQILYLELLDAKKSFLFRMCTMKEDLIEWKKHKYPRNEDIKDDKLNTIHLLSKDKKFIHAMKEAELDFKKGYDRLLASQSTTMENILPKKSKKHHYS
jgi:hypothetical protein